MKNREFDLHDGITGSAITVRVIPGTSVNEINKILGDGTIQIRLTTPTDEDSINLGLILFLAKVLKVNRDQIEIVGGLSGNDKLVTITGIDNETVQKRIESNLTKSRT